MPWSGSKWRRSSWDARGETLTSFKKLWVWEAFAREGDYKCLMVTLEVWSCLISCLSVIVKVQVQSKSIWEVRHVAAGGQTSVEEALSSSSFSTTARPPIFDRFLQDSRKMPARPRSLRLAFMVWGVNTCEQTHMCAGQASDKVTDFKWDSADAGGWLESKAPPRSLEGELARRPVEAPRGEVAFDCCLLPPTKTLSVSKFRRLSKRKKRVGIWLSWQKFSHFPIHNCWWVCYTYNGWIKLIFLQKHFYSHINWQRYDQKILS